uniref:Uncharacterized protein n=1 Tax=Arion vulgaris TaxID=1028688 RepID=A0A0B6ZTX1_9EUPU
MYRLYSVYIVQMKVDGGFSANVRDRVTFKKDRAYKTITDSIRLEMEILNANLKVSGVLLTTTVTVPDSQSLLSETLLTSA